MNPYANESEVVQIEGLTIENRTDRISLHGEVDITRDKAGLIAARRLKAIIDTTLKVLEADDTKGTLPDEISVEALVTVNNPFA